MLHIYIYDISHLRVNCGLNVQKEGTHFMKYTQTAGEYHENKDGNTCHLLEIIDIFLHCARRHFQHDLRTVIDVSDLINYRIKCYERESSVEP